MARLTNRDLIAILGIVQDLHEAQTLRDLGTCLCTSLRRVVGADNCTFSDLNPAGPGVQFEVMDPVEDCERGREIFARHMREHPLIAHFAATRDGRAYLVSDFLSRRELHRLALYNEYVRPFFGTEYQMAAAVTAASDRLVGFTLARSLRDFSERDRLIVNLLRPHVMQARRSVEWLQRLGGAIDALDRGLVLLDRVGRIQMVTERATHWMAEYFDRPHAGGLPDAVERWIRSQHQRPRAGEPPPARAPLTVLRQGRCLTLRLFDQPHGCLVMLYERTNDQARALQALGLTPTEARVLTWIADGKTSAEIAVILETRVRTIEKHLERIYRKLGVENRTAAATLVHERQQGGPPPL